MCTVTYLPQASEGFILTSNRDEAPFRSPQSISRQEVAGQQLIFPRDEAAGGTWIAASSAARLACILNGAFKPHQRRPPYRRSRGLMALDFFEFPSMGVFIQEYEFQGMEAFTMIVYERGSLLEFRWDESQQYVKELDPRQPYIWSSAPLYQPDVQRKREQWFAAWRARQAAFDREGILQFHRTAGDGDPCNDVVMNRGDLVRTLSITSVLKTEQLIDLQYFNLLSGEADQGQILLGSEAVGAR